MFSNLTQASLRLTLIFSKNYTTPAQKKSLNELDFLIGKDIYSAVRKDIKVSEAQSPQILERYVGLHS